MAGGEYKEDRSVSAGRDINAPVTTGDHNFAGATVNSSVNVGATPEAKSLMEVVAELKKELDNLGLPDAQKQELSSDLDTIESQMKSTNPKKGIISACIDSSKDILKRAAGSMVAKLALDQLSELHNHFQ